MKSLLFASIPAAVLLLLPGPTQLRGTPVQKAEDQPTSHKIDGAWSVVYAESGGKELTAKSVTNVAIKDGVLRYQRDGKDQAWRLEFGANQTVKAIPLGEKAAAVTTQMKVGVYIASPQYLCFALNRWTTDTKLPKAIGNGNELDQDEELQPVYFQDRALPAGGQDKMRPMGSDFVLILRRESPGR